MLTVTLCHSECCVPSGLDFEAAGDSIVCYFVCNYRVFASRASSSCKNDMPSGFDFEAAGDSVVRYFVCNYLRRGLRVAVNMTWALFRG